MKIVLEKHDEKIIEAIKKSENNHNNDLVLWVTDNPNMTYSVSFKVIDIAKANAFINDIIMVSGERAKEIQDAIGIDFTSLSLKNKKLIEEKNNEAKYEN